MKSTFGRLGTAPAYSNLAFSLAGWAVAERVYNTTFELLLKSLVYDPLLLNETSSVLTHLRLRKK